MFRLLIPPKLNRTNKLINQTSSTERKRFEHRKQIHQNVHHPSRAPNIPPKPRPAPSDGTPPQKQYTTTFHVYVIICRSYRLCGVSKPGGGVRHVNEPVRTYYVLANVKGRTKKWPQGCGAEAAPLEPPEDRPRCGSVECTCLAGIFSLLFSIGGGSFQDLIMIFDSG